MSNLISKRHQNQRSTPSFSLLATRVSIMGSWLFDHMIAAMNQYVITQQRLEKLNSWWERLTLIQVLWRNMNIIGKVSFLLTSKDCMNCGHIITILNKALLSFQSWLVYTQSWYSQIQYLVTPSKIHWNFTCVQEAGAAQLPPGPLRNFSLGAPLFEESSLG